MERDNSLAGHRTLHRESRVRREVEWLFGVELNPISDEDSERLDSLEAPLGGMACALQRANAHANIEAAWEQFYCDYPTLDMRPALERFDRARRSMQFAISNLQSWVERTGAQFTRLEEARVMFEDLGTAVSMASMIGCIDPSSWLATGVGLFMDQIEPTSSLVVGLASVIAERYAMRANQLDCLSGDLADVDSCMETATMTRDEIATRTAELASEVQRHQRSLARAQGSIDDVFSARAAFVLFGTGDISWPNALFNGYSRRLWAGIR